MSITIVRWKCGLLLELHRCYGKSSKVRPSWDTVFNPKTSRSQSIKHFRQKLSDSIDGNANPISNPKTVALLHSLFQTLSISEVDFKKSLIALYKSILQRRISDDEIYGAISQVSHKNVINLVVPKRVDGTQERQQKPAMQIHPEMKGHLGKVLKNIHISEENQNAAITKDELFQHSGKRSDSAPHSHIDLESLQEYLNKVEQGKKQRKCAWEEQKRYSWNLISNDSPKLSAGSLLFAYKSKPTRRPMLKLIQRLWRPASNIKTTSNRQSQKVPKELLIYNPERKSKIVIPASHSNSIFNINYRDLFAVINSSGHAPEETLNAIHQFESEGWTLIGDLYDNSENVVFQRSATKSDKRKGVLRIQIVSVTALLTLIGYGVFKPSNERKT